MALTLLEADLLAQEIWCKKKEVQSRGLERLLRRIFKRPKYRYASPMLEAMEREAETIAHLPFSGLAGRGFTYNIATTRQEEEAEDD